MAQLTTALIISSPRDAANPKYPASSPVKDKISHEFEAFHHTVPASERVRKNPFNDRKKIVEEREIKQMRTSKERLFRNMSGGLRAGDEGGKQLA